MSTYVLIHGAWHGGWCWNKVADLLRQAGHRVVAPDLPGRGADTTPQLQLTLDDYVAVVVREIDAQDEPVVLVGHSMGGASITQAAELRADRIRALVYLSAVAPVDGLDVMASIARHGVPLDLFGPGKVEVDAAAGCLVLMPTAPIKEIFFGQCGDEDVAFARAHLARSEASGPLAQAMQLSAQRYGHVPKIYIECLRDGAIPIALQRAMYASLGCRRVVTLDTDHSPFFSMPRALADALVECARIV